MTKTSFVSEIVRPATLPLTAGMLEGYEFLDCLIEGPAVLVPVDHVSFAHCGFAHTGDVDSMLWLREPGWIVGAVGLRFCTFTKCRFDGIGLAGPADALDRFRRMLRGETIV